MGSKRATDLAFSCTILLLFAGFAISDLAQDRAECADKLVGLATCLPYVSGESKAPTLDCCTGLKQVLDKSKKCICILIKDRDNPNLGININATLAVHLPTVCHTPANISKCVNLLHLAPNSPEAKVFEGLAKGAEANSSTRVPSANNATGGTGKGSSSSSDVRSGGERGKRWLVADAVCGVLPFVFIFHFFL